MTGKKRGAKQGDMGDALPGRSMMPEEASEEVITPEEDEETPRQQAGSGYRTAQRQRQGKRARKRRNTGLTTIIILVVVAAVVFIAAYEWKSVKDAAGWVGDRVSSLWEKDDTEQGQVDGLFLTNPVTGQEFQDNAINTLVALTDKDVIRSLVYISWKRDGSVSFYVIPEDIAGKTQDGNDLRFSQALSANPERLVELRYMAESLTGQPVHYISVIPLRKLLPLAEYLDFPAIRITRDTEMLNPFSGVSEKIAAGQEIKDMDRILSYLLAEGGPDEYRERERRSAQYLPELLAALSPLSESDLATALLQETGAFILSPAATGEGDRAACLGSLIAAWAVSGAESREYFSLPEIEIQNGCGVVGAGYYMKEQLEARGFKVAEYGRNAKVTIDGQEYNDFSHQASAIYFGSRDPLAEALARYMALLFKIPRVEYREGAGGIVVVVGNDLAVPAG